MANGYDYFLRYEPLSLIQDSLFKGDIAFWDTICNHPNYDKFWQDRSILPHLNNIKCAVVNVGGWFDAEDLYGPFHIYDKVEKENKGIFNILVVGPWKHGGMSRTTGDSLGKVSFENNEGSPSQYYQENVELAAAMHFLKDTAYSLDLPEALMFNTGENMWRKFNSWPPKNTKNETLFFGDEKTLSNMPPTENVYSYVSDPVHPVPYTAETTVKMTPTYMVEDQRFVENRKDVLSFSSPELNADVTIAGKILAKLYVSLSESDADFIVKIIDVYPQANELSQTETVNAGFEQLVRSEVFRGRFRHSYEHPASFVSNNVELVEFPLQDVLHTFKKGHKIMVQVHSTWFPLVDLNPQKYVDNIYKAKKSDFKAQTIKVYCSKEYPSGISFGSYQPEL
jgi:putative CocE/NonD family hydrolase